ncbi:MAG: hypothetical protein KGN77_13515 [Xanthomonadaceae bacterium]|nr:hypothetical protein [Xanthomonadaceae bacterium]MDE1965518.1 hypothetical protein [Xanthomonadaceae bacterium]
MSQQPLRDLIHRGESRARGYNDYNGGTYIGHDGQPHIRGSSRPIDFSRMTLGELQARQHRGEIFAVGLYRIIPDTMDRAVGSLGLDPNRRFTPALQDRIFSEYLVTDQRPEVRDYVTGKPRATLHAAEVAMALEWASFGDPDRGGASHYGGANRARIGVDETARALEQMRADYRAGVARGLSPDAAFRAVTVGDAPLQLAGSGRGGDGLPLRGDRDEPVTVVEQAREGRTAPPDAGRPAAPGSTAAATDDPLFRQALAGVQKIDADMGRPSDAPSRRLAMALAAASRMQGLARIDAVAISEDGSRTFAMQDDAGVRRYADVATAQAVHTPLAQSAARLRQPPQASTPGPAISAAAPRIA